MGQYNRAIITTAGENLIARAIVGEIQLNITKAKTSDHKYPGGTYFKDLTDMQGVKQVMASPETKVVSEDMIQTRSLFSNEEVQSTYYIQNIGLYAMDGIQEVLFCIVTATTPDEMPQYNGVAATSYIYNIQNVVQDAETIHITVSTAGNATIQDVMERVDATGGDISETIIETLEPIDTKYPVPSAGEKVKTFFGKILTFMKNIRPLTSDVTLYVATTGSDIAGDGTSAKPYRTIQYALDVLPKDLGGFVAKIFAFSGTYSEDLTISSFNNGVIEVATQTKPVTFKHLTILDCAANISVAFFNLYDVTSNEAVYIARCKDVILTQLSIIAAPTKNGVYCRQTEGFRVNACSFVQRSAAIYYENSSGWVSDCTGTGNSFGILVTHNSIVHLLGASLPGTTVQASGGMFVQQNGTQISGLISSGLSCTWGTIAGGYVRHGNLNGVAMVTIQISLSGPGNLNAGTEYIINGFPPSYMSNIAINFAPQFIVENCFLDGIGKIHIVFKSPITNAFGLLFNCTYLTNS